MGRTVNLWPSQGQRFLRPLPMIWWVKRAAPSRILMIWVVTGQYSKWEIVLGLLSPKLHNLKREEIKACPKSQSTFPCFGWHNLRDVPAKNWGFCLDAPEVTSSYQADPSLDDAPTRKPKATHSPCHMSTWKHQCCCQKDATITYDQWCLSG